MAAIKTVQITLLADRNFPVMSASGADGGFEAILSLVKDLNPSVEAASLMLAVWEEGLRQTLAKARQRRFPDRLKHLKVLDKPKAKPNPRPTA